VTEPDLPGSRPRRVHEPPAEPEAPAWDAYPREYRDAGGVTREWFPISALAEALGRDRQTIYLWERNGWLPKPSVRSPRSDGVVGHRLYTRAFIEGIVRIAREEDVMKPFARVGATQFPVRAFALMEATS
jgi:hypothetical protein